MNPLWLLGLWAVVGAVASGSEGDFVNDKLTRMISLTHPNAVKTTIAFKITSNNNKDKYTIYLPGEQLDAGRVAASACTVEANGQASPAPVQLEEGAAASERIQASVVLPQGFSTGTVTCTFVRVRAVSPLPKEILQTERQRMVFRGDFTKQLSPYLTKEEVTTVGFPQGKVDLLQPVSDCTLQLNKLLCTNAKEAGQKINVQYDSSSQVYAEFALVEREVELSHWGNAAVEEHFDLHNVGAKLKGGFSRLDHHRGSYIQELKSFLPPTAFGVYYRDALGNVTTSQLKRERTRQVVDLKLRFPVYGGWHIDWYQGFQLPVQELVQSSGKNRYVVETDAFHSVPLPAKRLVVHVVMPAGATDFKFELPPGAVASEFRRYTYLDVPWSARRVVSVELRDVLGGDFQEAGTLPRTVSGNKIRIHYKYEDHLVVEKPLAVASAVLAVMLTWMGLGRLSK